MSEPSIKRRLVGAALGCVIAGVSGAAFAIGYMVFALSLRSPYSHTEPHQAFRIELVWAALGAVFGALPELRYRRSLFAIAALTVAVLYVGTYDVFEIRTR